MNAISQSNHEQALKTISQWLAALRDLTSPGRDPMTAERIVLYAGMLAQWLPAGAFTAQSMAEVVRGEPYFPPVDTIRAKVAEWWADNQPVSHRRIGYSPSLPEGWDSADQAWVNFYEKREAEGFGAVSIGNRDYAPTSKAHCLSLLKGIAPRAFQVVSGQWSAPR